MKVFSQYYRVKQGNNNNNNNVTPSRSQVARYLWRHPEYSSEFATCLYHFQTATEHMRGNRNPSYKAMQLEKTAEMSAMRGMAMLLQEKSARIQSDLSKVDHNKIMFHPYFIDWHYISSQMPQHHKEFSAYSNSFHLYRSRTGQRSNNFPPWQTMRMTR
jgi:hypothetical protein